jgi:hypothetical protein
VQSYEIQANGALAGSGQFFAAGRFFLKIGLIFVVIKLTGINFE